VRLSEWRATAPAREAVAAKVIAVVEPVLATLGSEKDPECWVAWGDEPNVRWVILAPTDAGLVTLTVRVNIPQEGPRAGGKLIRWSRVQLGELTVEMQAGHRLTSANLEGVVLRGVDVDADRIGAFLQVVFAAMDGRPAPARPGPAPRARRGAPKG
jgi:hypothetical protein